MPNIRNTHKITVIGAGGGAQAMAAHLSLMGMEVNLYNRSQERIDAVQKNHGVQLSGVLNGFGKLNKISTDIAECLEGAEIIMVVVPASAHKDIARECAPHLKDGQVIVLNPGRTFGAFEFIHTLKNIGLTADITVAETQTILHTCRPKSGCEVEIFALKEKVPFAALPSNRTARVLESVQGLFPQFVAAASTLETGLNNVGAILHPVPTLLNAGWIESPRTAFKYYYEAITPTIARFLEKIDRERLALAEAMDVPAVSTCDWLGEVYGARGDCLYDALQKNDKYALIDAPATLQHRYIFEDVATGLVPMASLGKAINIPTPHINLVIELASSLLGTDFRKEGRTMENMGVSGSSVREIKELFEKRGL